MIKNKEYIRILAIIIFLSTFIMMISVLFQDYSTETLSKYGSRGNEVTQIQTKLKRWGYYKEV